MLNANRSLVVRAWFYAEETAALSVRSCVGPLTLFVRHEADAVRVVLIVEAVDLNRSVSECKFG